ncbi:MAG: phosphopantetheine-binding protein [Verrucomicrobia bacterium]|nr:phosphopantetheine-binding protein [Verrucomicrobiota bacterium]
MTCRAWDSVAVLAVLAVVDGSFGVQLSAADLNRCRTVADVYRLAVATAG